MSTTPPKKKRPPLKTLTHILDDLRPLAVPVASLNVDHENARAHGPRDLEAIRTSLEDLGQHRPLVVQKEGMVIRVGNGTFMAAQALGWKWIAAVVVDEDRMTSVRRAIVDNRTAELSSWDYTQLLDLLDENLDAGVSAELLGWDAEELERMLASVDDLPPPDPPPTEPVTFDATAAGFVRFKFGAISGQVSAEVYRAFQVRLAKHQSDEAPMLDDQMRAWLL